jgi:hypothetical protein
MPATGSSTAKPGNAVATQVNLYEAKTHLSSLVERAAAG